MPTRRFTRTAAADGGRNAVEVNDVTRDSDFEQVPGKRKARAAALLEVLTRFEPGRDYSEPEVNEVLFGVHEDFAYLRRELVNYHYLQRQAGVYRVAAVAPVRAANQVQEIPTWEAVWLPGFLAALPS